MRLLANDGRPLELDDRLPRLVEYLETVEDLVAAWLSGTYGTAHRTPLSDVDLAFLFAPGEDPCREDELTFRSDVLSALEEEDVSIVLLGKAGPVFQYRVVSTGRLLLVRDEAMLDDFVERVLSRHADYRIANERFLAEYDAALWAVYGDEAVEEEWRRELASRVAALDAGEAETISWEEVRDRLLARLE